MSKAQHTPGPWRVKQAGFGNAAGSYLHVVAYHPVAATHPRATGDIVLATPAPHFDPAEREANAHLICAAPAMLAALKWIEQETPDDDPREERPEYHYVVVTRDMIDAVRAAIAAAAEGRA